MVEYSRITITDSVRMCDPAVGYVEMLKAKNSTKGQLMAWNEKKAIREHSQELIEGSNLKRKENGTVMSSEAEENGLEQLLKIYWMVALER